MNDILGQRRGRAALNHKLLAAALVLAGAFSTAGQAGAQSFAGPSTPTGITPPVENTLFLVGKARGTQGYVCLPKDAGASWTVNGSRPEATLFTTVFGLDLQIITHFLSPDTNPNKAAPDPLPFANATWQSSLDSSKVWAQSVNSIPAGSDASCPNSSSIACLLLQAIGSDKGPTGGKILTQTTYIQRLNTSGGTAPADGCMVAGDVGKQVLVPYTADYYFFRGPQ